MRPAVLPYRAPPMDRAENMSFMSNIPLGFGTGALAVGLLLAGCSKPEERPPLPRPVRAVQMPTTHDLMGQQQYAARIEARHETAVAFEVGGRVNARRVDIGDTVAEGAVLAQLDDSDLRLRERDIAARLAASRAERSEAATALRRANDLRPKGFVSEAELDRATYRDRAAAAQTESLVARLELARRELAYATLTAPTAGVITARALETGQVVSAGQAAFTLARTDELDVVFDLPEPQRAGLPQTVNVTLWTRPDTPLTARVREVAPQAAADSRTYRVRATLTAADSLAPALGSSATVDFAGRATLPAIPVSAVLKRDDGQPAVWVIASNGTVHLSPVTLGPARGDQVSITGGLGAGDWVVTAGVHDLRDGQPVSLP